uniref:Uncharacterized protein n=1 Tax=Setaria viridis TaxID=4556 RepID=A0A4U6UG22_SETVI|nr:hypothetical protein SEVIR_5G075000v2 [Setaria viridis]
MPSNPMISMGSFHRPHPSASDAGTSASIFSFCSSFLVFPCWGCRPGSDLRLRSSSFRVKFAGFWVHFFLCLAKDLSLCLLRNERSVGGSLVKICRRRREATLDFL